MSKTFLPRKVHRWNCPSIQPLPRAGAIRTATVSAPSPRGTVPIFRLRKMGLSLSNGIVVSQGTTKSYPTVFLIPKARGLPSPGFFMRAENKIHHGDTETQRGEEEATDPDGIRTDKHRWAGVRGPGSGGRKGLKDPWPRRGTCCLWGARPPVAALHCDYNELGCSGERSNITLSNRGTACGCQAMNVDRGPMRGMT